MGEWLERHRQHGVQILTLNTDNYQQNQFPGSPLSLPPPPCLFIPLYMALEIVCSPYRAHPRLQRPRGLSFSSHGKPQ